jgi:hypothetical protein
MDGHNSHKSLEAIMEAKQAGIHLLTIPPHTSHKLQPLDKTFFGPLKTHYNEECSKFMTNNPGKRITLYHVASLFGKAYERSATMSIAINGFKETGIHPFNPDIFNDFDFMAADRLLTNEIPDEPEERHRDEPEERHRTPSPSIGCSEPDQPNEMLPSCSHSTKNILQIPVMKRTMEKVTRKRRHEKSEILTSTPYKEELENQQKTKPKKNVQSIKKCLKKISKKKVNKKRKMSDLSSSISEVAVEHDEFEENGSHDYYCVICNEALSDPPDEDMIQCFLCKEWAHEDCTDFDKRVKMFTCDFCRK